jgi:hypothetical protein
MAELAGVSLGEIILHLWLTHNEWITIKWDELARVYLLTVGWEYQTSEELGWEVGTLHHDASQDRPQCATS